MTEAARNYDPLNETVLADDLANENADIVARAKGLTAKAEEWEAFGPITNDEDAADLADFLRQVQELSGDKGTANVRREKRKGPYTVCAQVVQDFFKKGIIDGLEAKRKTLLAKGNAWIEKKRKAAEAESQRLAAEARKKMEEAKTAEQVKAAAATMKAAEAAAKPTGVKSDFGSKIHQTSRWAYEVLDITKVPTKFLAVDSTAIMAFVKTGSPENPVTIPGVRVYRATSAVGG